MKRLLYVLPIMILIMACTPKATQVAQAVPEVPQKIELMNYADSISYLLGSSSAEQMRKGIPSEANLFNKAMFQLGFEEGYEEKSRFDLSDSEKQAMFTRFQEEISAVQAAKAEKEAAEGKKAGETFLAENGKKEGVMTTASGLQYKVLTPGTGATPSASDKVEVHYEGRLIDGTIFDSSYQRGAPATFGVTQVISGWTEALQLMKEGAKYQLFIPSDLAYGNRATGKIKPGDTLIFDVELIKIIK